MDRTKSKLEQRIVTKPRPPKSDHLKNRKGTNTRAFNLKVKARRIKAKFAARSRKINRRKK